MIHTTTRYVLLATIAAFANVPALAQVLPQLQGGSIRAQVESLSAGHFKFQYRIAVAQVEPLSVYEFTVASDQGIGRAVLDKAGLPEESSMVLPTTRREREETVDKAVALAISGIPSDWSAGVDREGRVRWGSNVGSSRVGAGVTLGGFEISTRALPGIREGRLEPDLYDLLPNVEEEPNAMDVYEQIPASTQTVKTVGPMAPPAPFVPRAFADEIEVMLNEARTQGWISTDEARNALAATLANLKTALDANEFDDARAAASAFITDASSMGCGVYSCGGSHPLSSEAYALMRFNMEYLRDRIPTTIRTTVIETDEDMDSFIVDEIFRGEGRIGDAGGTTSQELSLVQDLAGPEQMAQFPWSTGISVPFVLSFDGRAATFDVAGGARSIRTESLIFPLVVSPENVFVRARAIPAGSVVTVSNLVLDGIPIAETIVADANASGLGILRIEASGLGDGFSLRGNILLQWTGSQPVGSDLSVQLRAVDAIAGPD